MILQYLTPDNANKLGGYFIMTEGRKEARLTADPTELTLPAGEGWGDMGEGVPVVVAERELTPAVAPADAVG